MPAKKPLRTGKSPTFDALARTGRDALRLEGRLELVHQWLAEMHLSDRVLDFEWPLRLVYRPIKINRSDDGQSVVLDHELALVVDVAAYNSDFFDASEVDMDEADLEDAELGSLVYAQRWKAKRGDLPEDDIQILLFALTVGRGFATERARDLLLLVSSHLGRPPLAVAPPETPRAALDNLLQALRPVVSGRDEVKASSD